ncbi:MAG: hypothetical protein P1U83_07950 [Roseovarius sp.]|nr:hypothetical protein [Roseovarius sp.]
MGFSITNELRRTFDLASLRLDAAKRLNGNEWRDYAKIKKDFDAKRQFEERRYRLEYKTRIDAVRKRLINEAGSPVRDYVPFFARRDRFDRPAITRQAQIEVRDSHGKTMASLDQFETRSIDGLLDRADERIRKQPKPARDFEKATDRRAGVERRVARPRQRER